MLDHELTCDKNIELGFTGERTLFLAALRNLKLGKITAAQLATIHLIDSAIHTLYLDPMLYLIYKFLDKNDNFNTTTLIAATQNPKGMPNVIKRYPYDSLELPKKGMSISALPHRMQKPLIKRFFNFSDAEWEIFCEAMAKTPLSEQSYHVLNAPEAGCWSSIIFQIQKLLKCLRILDRLVESKEGFKREQVMLVPSFSMFQAAINAKAQTLGRKTLELIPTYGYIELERYHALKASGKIALTLYMPEKCTSSSDMIPEISSRNRGDYKDDVNFRTTIDGHDRETAFAGAIHDVYHAMRELAMSENIAKARMRLASIAKTHPRNKYDTKSPSVAEILIDGELIFSFPPQVDTIFDLEYRAPHAQSFGDLFYTISLRAALHKDLKNAFLKDMVVNKRLWKNEYNLGRSDLRKKDQVIFDYFEAIESCKDNKRSSSAPKGRSIVLGITTAMVTLGILGATRSREILSHSPNISNIFAKNQ